MMVHPRVIESFEREVAQAIHRLGDRELAPPQALEQVTERVGIHAKAPG
jgi:AraC-like DNA-binding protein